MRYPDTNDELMKEAILSWLTDICEGDEHGARTMIKMHLAIAELRERGFSWTDV